MATLMDLIAGYSQGGAPVDDSSQSLGQAARDLYQGLINPKAWQEVKQATQRTTNIAPAVLESLARGSIAQVPGTIGDTSSLLRQLAPQTMQQIFGNRVAPTTEEILGYVPRATPAYQGSQEHEMVGGLLSPAMGYFAKALPLATKDMPIGNMIAYHGTPHEIKGGFDISKVGTGEGAQAYGHGMYFAQNPAVAEGYKRDLSNFYEPFVQYGKQKIKGSELSDSDLNVFKYLELGQKDAGQFKHNTVYYAKKRAEEANDTEALKKLKEHSDIKFGEEYNSGNLYKVDIPDEHLPTYMDYDKSLGEQSPIVKKALNEIKKKITPEMKMELGGDLNLLFGKDVTPVQFLNTMEIIHSTGGVGIGEKMLNEHGVRGVHYLDNFSRDWRILHPDEAVSGKWTVGKWPGGGKETKYFDTEQEAKDYFNQNQTKNFVVFDPKHVKILEKNNQKIGE